MTYKINTTDGNLLTEIPDGRFETDTTPLTLIGRGITNFGEAYNENIIKLLENFASTTQPEKALKGQLWYDTANNKLNVYDGNIFKPSGGPIVSPQVPTTLVTGDLWINNDTNQLWFYDGTDLVLAGPVYKNAQGQSGFVIDTILDINNRSRVIAKLFVGSVLLGIFSSVEFQPLLAIPGYGPVSKIVKVGFNAADFANIKFDVTVTRAETILTDLGVPKTATELVFSNEENTFTEKLTVQNNNGIVIGGQEQASLSLISDDFIIASEVGDKDMYLRVKANNISKSAITIKNTDNRVGIFQVNPVATLDVDGDVYVSGNITVGGESVTLNTTTITAEDKNIVLASGVTEDGPGNDGGGITLKGTTDKTIQYNTASTSWDLSENVNLPAGKKFRIGNVDVLSQDTLGSGVTMSNIQSLGVLSRIDMAAGLTILNDSITSTAGSLSLVSNNSVITVNSNKISNLADPTLQQDAATKQYVDTTIYLKPLSLSMDITGLTNVQIAEVLDSIMPFYDPITDPNGVAINNTVLRLHGTVTSVSNAQIQYNPTEANGNFTRINVSGADVVEDISSSQVIDAPAATVTVTRQNKRFIMTAGNWVFDADF